MPDKRKETRILNFDLEDISDLEKAYRINLINSITGIKPANLIGTVSTKKITNLAVFSSVVHLGSTPPLVGFVVRPSAGFRRDTYQNILDTGIFTINHIPNGWSQNAHYTSAKFDSEVSEFDICQFDEHWLPDFQAPFVGQSAVKFGCSYQNSVKIELNNTHLVIGKIERIIVNEDLVSEKGQINLQKSNSMGISGLDAYYSLTKEAEYPFVRGINVPDFNNDNF